MNKAIVAPITILLLLLFQTTPRAQATSDFYRGKNITFIVGTAAGGDYDAWSRIIGRHMSKYIPGNPTFVTRNMPGSGFIVSANHLYNVAPRDGTVIGMMSRNIPYSAAEGLENVRYDPLKMHWIGNPDVGNRVCFSRTDSGILKAEDLFERELIVAGTGLGSGISATPTLLKHLLGMKFKIVEGYTSNDHGGLAMERGEVQGLCDLRTAFIRRRPDWVKSGFVRELFNMEPESLPDVAVPTIFKFIKTEEQASIVSFYSSSIKLGRPLVAPPELPADRVELLRRAFDAAMKDPLLLKETEGLGFKVASSTGEEVQALVAAVLATPKDIVDKMKALVNAK